MAITMRAFEPRDSEAVRYLFGQLTGALMTPDEMQSRVDFVAASPIDWLYVAESEGVVCGALAFRLRERIERPGRYGEIYAIVADAAQRRQGVGRAMLAFAEQLARDHECVGTWLVSGFRRADEAHLFYEQLGYAKTGYRFVKLVE